MTYRHVRPLGSPSSLSGADPEFSHLSSHCAHISPISPSSFYARQQSLARTLYSLNASAYVAEPGASAGFFANLSGAHWSLSERPLLLIVSPELDAEGTILPRMSILTPSFEATRAKLLPIPSASDIAYPAWPEDANPFEVAISAIRLFSGGPIFVDDNVRSFVADGLQKAAPQFRVSTAPVEVRHLRERKSKEELEIMKCVNEVTLLAIRAVRDKMYFGMHESQARQLIISALTSAGLHNVGAITLFGENAALPHGSGTDRVLSPHDFVLIDCDGSLHGYNSDVTRTFALAGSTIHTTHLRLWSLVHSAQANAITAARNGSITAEVDRAARETLSLQGYGQYFTHRLGHGIGLEVHESPYLRGGSGDIILTGHTFSDEPGIYIEGQVGVRLEDCFFVDQDGTPVFLTAGVGGAAADPWHP
ncbi:peptidase M24 [Sparassis latifolia]